ncbi:MAG: translocation/assembly module TamB domain-containing protein [Pseudomonadota bacterium]
MSTDEQDPKAADAPKSASKRRLWPWVVAVFALLLLLPILTAAYIDSAPGKRQLVRLINNQPNIELEGISGSLFDRVTIDGLAVRDDAGVWLSIDQATMAWRPFGLLTGRLEIKTLAASTIALDRLPKGDEAPEPAEPGPIEINLPKLPLSVAINDIAFSKIDIGKDAFGQAATLSLTGKAVLTPAWLGEVDIDLTSASGKDEFEAKVVRMEGTTDLTLKGDFQPDGLVATIAKLTKPVALAMTGAGPNQAWRGTLFANAGDYGEITGPLRTEAETLVLDLLIAPQSNILATFPPVAQELVGDTVKLDLTLTPRLGTDGSVAFTMATSMSGASIEGRGGIGFNGPLSANDIRFDLQTGPLGKLTPADDVRLEKLVATILADGPILSPAATVTIEVNDFAYQDLQMPLIELTGRLSPTSDQRALAFALDVSSSPLEGPDPAFVAAVGAPALALKGSYVSSSEEIKLTALSLNTPIADLSGSGEANLKTGRNSVTLELIAPDLTAVPGAQSLIKKGGFVLTANIRQPNAESALKLDGTASADQLAFLSPELSKLLGATPDIAFAAERAPDGTAKLETLRVTGERLLVKAAGRVASDQTIDGRYDIALRDLGTITPALETDGILQIAGAVRGQANDPTITAAAGLSRLEVNGSEIKDIRFAAEARTIVSAPIAEIALDAATPFGPFEAKARGHQQETGFRLETLFAALPGIRVEATGGVENGQSPELDAVIRLDSEKPITGAGLRLTSDLVATAKIENQSARVAVDGSRTRLYQSGVRTFSLGETKVALQARLKDIVRAIDLDASLTGFETPSIRFANIDFEASGDATDLVYEVRADGQALKPITAQISGRRTLSDQIQTITANLKGKLGEFALHSPSPLTLRMAPGSTSLSPSEIRIDGPNARSATITTVFESNAASQTGRAAVSIDSIPLKLIETFMALPASGSLNANAEVESADGTSTATFIVAANRLLPKGKRARGATPVRIQVAGDYADLLTARILVDEDQTIDGAEWIVADLELTPKTTDIDTDAPKSSLFAFPVPDENTQLTGSITLDAPIRAIADLAAPPGQTASGKLAGKIVVSGTLSESYGKGSLSLREGGYENADAGVFIEAINALLSIDRRTIEITEFSAEDGGNGSLEISGTSVLSPADFFPASLTIDAKSFRLIEQDHLVVDLSSALTLSHSKAQTRISGDIDLDRVEYEITSFGGANIASLDVREVGEPQHINVTQNVERQPNRPVALDISVNAPRRIFIRGKGLTSEWGANLKVNGQTPSPRVRGTVNAVRGQFDFSGKRFDLERGTIGFNGAPKIDPQLDIAFMHDFNQYEATIAVRGFASKPELVLSAEPALPEDEILSRILFGDSPANLSAVEAAQLALALASLSGDGGGFDAIGRVRRGIGIDRLNVGSSEGGATQVTGGKYITENVYLEVTTEPATGRTLTGIQWDLTQNFSLLSQMDSTNQTNFAIRWAYDY